MNYHLTKQGMNSKVGYGVAVSTTSSESCPDACPLKGKGCYASLGPMFHHWKRVSSGERGNEWETFLNEVSGLYKGQLFRHNQAGDLPGVNNKIDSEKLSALSDIIRNKKLKAWSYTHKPLDNESNQENLVAVKNAIEKGFIINASADNLREADELKALGVPVAVVLPSDSANTVFTPQGNKVVVCPSQTKENVTCSSCQLCLKGNRSVIIGFKAHGVMKKKVSALVQ